MFIDFVEYFSFHTINKRRNHKTHSKFKHDKNDTHSFFLHISIYQKYFMLNIYTAPPIQSLFFRYIYLIILFAKYYKYVPIKLFLYLRAIKNVFIYFNLE